MSKRLYCKCGKYFMNEELFNKHKKNCDEIFNFDEEILNERERIYLRTRKNKFIEMYKKYLNDRILKIDLKSDDDIIEKNYDNGTLEIIYNINKSITQSLRSITGKNFENLIESAFKKYNISYSKQVIIDCEGMILKKKDKKRIHKIDFMIPSPEFNINIKDYKGKIISCKTTLRERYLEDAIYDKIYLISLEKIESTDKIISIQINKDTKDFTNFLISLIS